jgi:hypothetical protein
MDELINLLTQFNKILQNQRSHFLELMIILDQEEAAILEYRLSSLEKAFILKDQHIRLGQHIEDKRISILKKICSLIAFDMRGQTPSLKMLQQALSVYVQNVQKLIHPDFFHKLTKEKNNFFEICHTYKEAFDIVEPRIYRNQFILKKLIKNVNLSLSLFQSEAEVGMNYDALGKAQSLVIPGNSFSSVRIKA